MILRALCKSRAIICRATAKNEDLEKALRYYEDRRVEKEASSSEGEPVEVEKDALAPENEGEEDETAAVNLFLDPFTCGK
ncbi:hypothetical protein NDU88_003381 [Pleurodeles waltl]|uniref:Uncharacterized protein n=1 Tax=Pleurodeles waltl TaxID=8319 RepID=A0AAV7VH99_PLEWA|nr:hypothetical protein NDU88_003381 [Pleurodeles waltl]